MKLNGYIKPYMDYSFSIPIYYNGINYFLHSLNSNLQVCKFDEFDIDPDYFIEYESDLFMKEGDYGIVVFIGENSLPLIDYADSIVKVVNDSVVLNSENHKNLIEELNDIELTIFQHNIVHKSENLDNVHISEESLDLVFCEENISEKALISYMQKEKTPSLRNIFLLSEYNDTEKLIELKSLRIILLNTKLGTHRYDCLNEISLFYSKHNIQEPKGLLYCDNVISRLKEGELYYFIDNFQRSNDLCHIGVYENNYKSLSMTKKEYLWEISEHSGEINFPLQAYKAFLLKSMKNYSLDRIKQEMTLESVGRQIVFLEELSNVSLDNRYKEGNKYNLMRNITSIIRRFMSSFA